MEKEKHNNDGYEVYEKAELRETYSIEAKTFTETTTEVGEYNTDVLLKVAESDEQTLKLYAAPKTVESPARSVEQAVEINENGSYQNEVMRLSQVLGTNAGIDAHIGRPAFEYYKYVKNNNVTSKLTERSKKNICSRLYPESSTFSLRSSRWSFSSMKSNNKFKRNTWKTYDDQTMLQIDTQGLKPNDLLDIKIDRIEKLKLSISNVRKQFEETIEGTVDDVAKIVSAVDGANSLKIEFEEGPHGGEAKKLGYKIVPDETAVQATAECDKPMEVAFPQRFQENFINIALHEYEAKLQKAYDFYHAQNANAIEECSRQIKSGKGLTGSELTKIFATIERTSDLMSDQLEAQRQHMQWIREFEDTYDCITESNVSKKDKEQLKQSVCVEIMDYLKTADGIFSAEQAMQKITASQVPGQK